MDQVSVIVGQIWNKKGPSCALCEESMKFGIGGVWGCAESKNCGNHDARRSLHAKNAKFKMAAVKTENYHHFPYTCPICVILMSVGMFWGSRNPMKHIKSTSGIICRQQFHFILKYIYIFCDNWWKFMILFFMPSNKVICYQCHIIVNNTHAQYYKNYDINFPWHLI